LFEVYIALVTGCIGKKTRASLAKWPGGNKRVCVKLCAAWHVAQHPCGVDPAEIRERLTAEQGAQTSGDLATSRAVENLTGKYWEKSRAVPNEVIDDDDWFD
jgi:hypothetical protein